MLLQCIVTALSAESEPIIEYFDLKKVRGTTLPIFFKNNIYLIKVGVGKMNIEKYLLDFYKFVDESDIQFINIGIAGGSKKKHKIKEMYSINKITDQNSNTSFYPEMLVNHNLEESSIITVPKPITEGSENYNSLVDMEAFEIFRVCAKIVPIKNLIFFKIVSDYMSVEAINLKKQDISFFIKSKLDLIKDSLHKLKILSASNDVGFSSSDQEWINKTIKIMRLTESQKFILLKKVRWYRLKHYNLSLPKVEKLETSSKVEKNKIFNNVIKKLTS